MCARWLLSPFTVTGWTIQVAFVLCPCLAALLVTSHTSAQVTVKVDDTKIKVLLAREPSEVFLPIENLTGAELHARIYLDVVDTTNKVIAETYRLEVIRSAQTISFPLPFFVSKLNKKNVRSCHGCGFVTVSPTKLRRLC